MFLEYIFLFKFLIFCLLVILALFFISFLLVFQLSEAEKLSSYECGFNPFGDARNKFEVRFYLVGVLFIIFDLEISFLFPWIITLYSLSFSSFYAMFIFIFILTIGFFYEWVKGALEWE